MNYYLIGACAIVALIVLVIIIKAIKKQCAKKYFEEDIAWQVSKARKMGIPLDNVRFDANDSLLDPSTRKPIQY